MFTTAVMEFRVIAAGAHMRQTLAEMKLLVSCTRVKFAKVQ